MMNKEKQAVKLIKELAVNKAMRFHFKPDVTYFPGWCLFDTTQSLSAKAAAKLYTKCLWKHRGEFCGYFLGKVWKAITSAVHFILEAYAYSIIPAFLSLFALRYVVIRITTNGLLGYWSFFAFLYLTAKLIQKSCEPPQKYKYDENDNFIFVTVHFKDGKHYDYRLKTVTEEENEFVFVGALAANEDMVLLQSACNRLSKLEKFLLMPNYPYSITKYEPINKSEGTIEAKEKARDMYFEIYKENVYYWKDFDDTSEDEIHLFEKNSTLDKLLTIGKDFLDENKEDRSKSK